MTRYIILLFVLCSCVARERQSRDPLVKTFKSVYGGVGYDILIDGKIVIHQPTIPALDGNSGFPTEKSARKVAMLVVQKIKDGHMPPSVTAREVNSAMHGITDSTRQGRR